MSPGAHSVGRAPGSAGQPGMLGEVLSLAPLEPRAPKGAASTQKHALQPKRSWESWNDEANKP